MIADRDIWLTILFLGVGTFLIRFSFIGAVGKRELPEWALRHLRYVPVAVMPALVAPLVVWPAATAGVLDAPRLVAAAVALAVGILTRSTVWAVVAGMVALYSGLAVG